jgi:hypothetical protein
MTDTTPPADDAAVREAAERIIDDLTLYRDGTSLYNSDQTDEKLPTQMYADITLVARAYLEAQAREAVTDRQEWWTEPHAECGCVYIESVERNIAHHVDPAVAEQIIRDRLVARAALAGGDPHD